jgi:hypothetical protein
LLVEGGYLVGGEGVVPGLDVADVALEPVGTGAVPFGAPDAQRSCRGPAGGWNAGCPGERAVDVDAGGTSGRVVDADEMRPAAKRWCGADGCRLGRGSGIRVRQDEFPLVGAGGVFQLESTDGTGVLADDGAGGRESVSRAQAETLKDWLVVRTGPLVSASPLAPSKARTWPRAESVVQVVPVADRVASWVSSALLSTYGLVVLDAVSRATVAGGPSPSSQVFCGPR